MNEHTPALHPVSASQFDFTEIARIIRCLVHDMNNPLGTIRLHVECALSALPEGDSGASEVRESLAQIDSSVDRAQVLTQALRRLSRAMTVESDLRSLVPFDEVVRKVVAGCKEPLARQGVQVLVSASSQAPRVRVAPGQIEDALSYLVANAVDAVSTAARKEIRLELGVAGGVARCVVSDSGTGVKVGPGELFTPFAASADRKSGTRIGLSLPLARVILRAHGGDVELVSSTPEGASFAFWVPIEV